jgi:CRISPR/Cas system CSM-associated protein Csm2 small subunit
VLIDIVPSIGVFVESSETGVKGDALSKAIESFEPYYLR